MSRSIVPWYAPITRIFGGGGDIRREPMGAQGSIGFDGGAGGKGSFEIKPMDDGTWLFEGKSAVSVAMQVGEGKDGKPDMISGMLSGSLEGFGDSPNKPNLLQEVKIGFKVGGPEGGVMGGSFSAETGHKPKRE